MPANFKPVFPRTPLIGSAVITAANLNLDGTGTLATVFPAAGADGSRVDSIKVKALGTNVASVLRIFVHNGTTAVLYHEKTLPATTMIQTAELPNIEMKFDGNDLPQLVLPQGYSVRASLGTAVASGWAVVAIGGSYTA